MTERRGRFESDRREQREETYIPTKFKRPSDDVYQKGGIKDISDGGVRLDSEFLLEQGDRIEFIVDDPAHGHYIATAVVKWVGKWTSHSDGRIGEGMHKYGLEIKRKDAI
jgi:hypothetical protein